MKWQIRQVSHAGCESRSMGFCLNAFHSCTGSCAFHSSFLGLLGMVDAAPWLCLGATVKMHRVLKSGRLLSNLVYSLFVAFQKDKSFQNTKIWLVFSTTTDCGTAIPYGPGSEPASAQPPQPIPRQAGVTARLHIPWMGTAAPCHLDLPGLSMADQFPYIHHLQRRLYRKLAR